MWYSGTASVTTGSVEVIGDANVDFIANIFAGDAFISDGNGLSIEILRVESKAKLILARRYTGPAAASVLHPADTGLLAHAGGADH
ncbi:hypothetical protein JT366_08470 [Sphingomonas paucimobilis]|uniref:hypothetical protein n=1 Tax=Sphingomonas paucimobilis TaxID=13689 RepID=UPI0019656786|nr:hypothetical protein [Sphingomonas paucimobilis]QRY97238.1 hypothetical protein JT366_08470 [Sphingomonas paucimobilis]